MNCVIIMPVIIILIIVKCTFPSCYRVVTFAVVMKPVAACKICNVSSKSWKFANSPGNCPSVFDCLLLI